MITFNVNSEALRSLDTRLCPSSDIKQVFDKKVKSSVEACGSSVSNVITNSFSHPFVEAAHIAYAYHYPLILSPDSVWLCIAQGFANHINVNAEALRKRFVAHEGKKAIIIRRDHFIKGDANNDWQGCFNEFSDKLAEHIGKKRDLIVSNFTTTGPIERAASEIVLMDSMKSYFKYGMRTMCGIPTITLTGEVSDWENIKERVANLTEYDLEWWTKPLSETINHLVEAAKGNPDIMFFDSLYKERGGSGGPFANGWINTLFPYLENYKGNFYKNEYVELDGDSGYGGGPTLDSFSNGLSKVPFKWEIGAQTHDMEFLGGMIGVNQDIETKAVSPAIGWAIRDTGSVKPGPINESEDW